MPLLACVRDIFLLTWLICSMFLENDMEDYIHFLFAPLCLNSGSLVVNFSCFACVADFCNDLHLLLLFCFRVVVMGLV